MVNQVQSQLGYLIRQVYIGHTVAHRLDFLRHPVVFDHEFLRHTPGVVLVCLDALVDLKPFAGFLQSPNDNP